MKSTKYCMENLFLYDYKHVEEHLSAMAAKGWRLESIGARLWKYRRAEPGKVRYAVTYIQDASQFNPGPTERQQTLKELCAAAGWEKVCDWFQMQIYCSEAEDPVPLETEESVRLETVHRSMKRNYLPSNTVFLILSLAVSVWFVCTLAADPLRILENSAYLFIGPLLFLLSAILSITLGLYWRWYRRSSRSVAQGGPCASPGKLQWINRAAYGFLIPWTGLYLLSQLAAGQKGPVIYFAVHMLLVCLLVFLLRKTTALLRRMKASWGLNLFLTLLADVVLAIVLAGGLSYAAIHGGWFSGNNGDTYMYRSEEWDVSPTDLPLTISDLTGREYDHIRRYAYSQGSVFMLRRSCRETVLTEDERIWLSYKITMPQGWLYDMVLQNTLDPQEETYSHRMASFSWVYTWEEVPAAPWDAEAAYRQLLNGEPRDTWLLVFPDRLAEFSPEWDLTPEQMALAGDILKNA